MTKPALNMQIPGDLSAAADQRCAPRFNLLIRSAKLIAAQGEFVCIVRDVSETGVSLRLFHALPRGDAFELQMQSGERYGLVHVWTRGGDAGFEFAEPIDVAKLISDNGRYPKRGLRFDLHIPITVSTLDGTSEALVLNLSQQGARFQSERLLAIDQCLQIKGECMKEVRAKVRWRRDSEYGVVFDDTYSLSEIAELVARLQAPALLEQRS